MCKLRLLDRIQTTQKLWDVSFERNVNSWDWKSNQIKIKVLLVERLIRKKTKLGRF